MRVPRATQPQQDCRGNLSSRQQWITALLRSAWDWINAESPPLSHVPRPAGRMEILFSLSVFVFAASALTVIVSKAAGDQFSVLVFAVAAGAFGAATSMLGRTRTRRTHSLACSMRCEPAWSSIMLKMAVGSGAAYLLYLLAKLGILAGGPFPELNHLDEEGAGFSGVVRILSVVDFTKLMAGCFLAGFSERFVSFTRSRSGGRS